MKSACGDCECVEVITVRLSFWKESVEKCLKKDFYLCSPLSTLYFLTKRFIISFPAGAPITYLNLDAVYRFQETGK